MRLSDTNRDIINVNEIIVDQMNLSDIKLDQVNTCESSVHRPEVAVCDRNCCDSINAFSE